jgi:hypothetical protein
MESDKLPVYILVRPAINSAIPSKIPINKPPYPICAKYKGKIGYIISLLKSLKRLINEIIRMLRVIFLNKDSI